MCRLLRNLGAGHRAAYPDREQATFSGRDVNVAGRVLAPVRQLVDAEQSDAARAEDTDTALVAATISKAAILEDRMVDFPVSMQIHTGQDLWWKTYHTPELDARVAYGAGRAMPT